ncbi:MAG: Grx4 family monothiol glutaredoxin [Betaproteobacteria bacterium]|nr:Grx4 family monothiol glutaredoxin [Betaproteobacteria bacterium]
MNANWKDKIETDVKNNKVVVYMRGTPNQPRCGFSARVVRVFNELNVPFKTEDMDSDPDLWKTLSAMNNWPTSPQIYINGEFVGGCDIVTEMYRSGDLQKELGLT